MARRTQEELNRLAPRVAQLKFEVQGPRVPPRTDRELLEACRVAKDHLNVSNIKDARRLVERAFKNGLAKVRVDVQPQPRLLKIHRKTSEDVTTVLHAQGIEDAEAWVYDHGEVIEDEAEIHRDLAWAAGQEVARRELVHPDGRLCFGAGRSVFWFLRSYASAPNMRFEKLTLYSLCGSSERGTGAEPGSLNSDVLLARFIDWAESRGSKGTKARFCTLPVALPKEYMGRGDSSLLRGHAGYLLEDWWEKRKPDLVVSGLDLIDLASVEEPAHPFLVSKCPALAIRDEEPKPAEVLKANPASAVAEILHYPWLIGSGSHAPDVVKLVERLRARVVAPLPPDLSHARHRMVIAGGRRKSGALVDYIGRAAGDSEVMQPSLLVTDSAGADALMSEFSRRY